MRIAVLRPDPRLPPLPGHDRSSDIPGFEVLYKRALLAPKKAEPVTKLLVPNGNGHPAGALFEFKAQRSRAKLNALS